MPAMITPCPLAFIDSPEQLLVIAAIFALLFGASRLPQLGSAMGKTIKNFKEEMREPAVASAGPAAPASTSAARLCSQCGAASADPANGFCTRCGARL